VDENLAGLLLTDELIEKSTDFRFGPTRKSRDVRFRAAIRGIAGIKRDLIAARLRP
jgi:hypothetical protein